MITTLAVTKYTLPPQRPRQIGRDGLMARLLAGLDRKLTLISAPAGFGKSTLAALLAHRAAGREGWRAAWLSLDRSDNDPARWGAYLTAALRQAGLPLDEAILETADLDTLAVTVINAAARAGSPILFVLDDYHLIQSAEIHGAVALMLERMPPNFHFVMATRVRPPLPLARLKARGDLAEVTAADLRLSDAEAAAFLRGTMRLDLPAEGVAALMARTEGWVAGLQLAALSLQGAPDWAAAVGSFGGRSPDVLEYLLGEVTDHQPESIRSFLLPTAILDRLTGPLCDAVTGRTDGARTLQALEQANLFVFPLDPERRWYRYHPLFADFLLARLQGEVGEAGVADLHRRAAEWYHREGQLTEAVDSLLAAGAFAQAADWIEAGFADWSARGALLPLRRWVDQLPKSVFAGRPRLATLAAWVLIAGGDVEADHRYTQAAEYLEMAAGELKPDAREALGVLAAVRTALAPWAPLRQCPMCIIHDVAHADEAAGTARDLLPAESLFWRSVVSNSLGSVYLRAGDVTGAAQAFGEAARLGARSGNLAAAVAALQRHAQLLTMLGRPGEAEEADREALRLAERCGGEALPLLAPIYLGLGLSALERNDLEAAARHLTAARARYEAGGSAPPEALLALARLHQARGEAAAARELVDQAGELLAAQPKLRAAAIAAWPEGVRVLLALGDLAGARRWVQAGGVAPEQEPGLWRAPEFIALARVLVAEGQLETALQVLAGVQAATAASGCRGLEAEARLVEAQARQALREGGYAEQRQATLPGEPLTPREREILQLIAGGASNQDVASQLFMGVSTVKWHLINIYGKLQVRSRTQAVACAREYGLVP